MEDNGQKGYFRDGIVASLYGLDVMTYQVEVQENVLTPGKYRVIAPYGAGTEFYNTYVDVDSPVFNGPARQAQALS